MLLTTFDYENLVRPKKVARPRCKNLNRGKVRRVRINFLLGRLKWGLHCYEPCCLHSNPVSGQVKSDTVRSRQLEQLDTARTWGRYKTDPLTVILFPEHIKNYEATWHDPSLGRKVSRNASRSNAELYYGVSSHSRTKPMSGEKITT